VLKALPKIFGHSDKTVRAEGNALALAIYQYLGPGIEPWLADLKPVQVKELKEAFEGLEKDGKGKGALKPERLTRAQAREAEAAGDAVEEGGDAPAQGEWLLSLYHNTRILNFAQRRKFLILVSLLKPLTLYPNCLLRSTKTSNHPNGKSARRFWMSFSPYSMPQPRFRRRQNLES
jgi:hypothetical protein